ncbi:MAG: hypothetical protein E4H40_05270 [Candidatus Brocadiia bacterium]|nr:MAG: hypothetical protein E4H40_05270 [Candidatus Brocadiia bacterium]
MEYRKKTLTAYEGYFSEKKHKNYAQNRPEDREWGMTFKFCSDMLYFFQSCHFTSQKNKLNRIKTNVIIAKCNSVAIGFADFFKKCSFSLPYKIIADWRLKM